MKIRSSTVFHYDKKTLNLVAIISNCYLVEKARLLQNVISTFVNRISSEIKTL